MPTGYTFQLAAGKVTNFRDFAMSCARAFGACIDLRDEPASTPIPETFEPSPYHQERLAEALSELARVEGLSAEKWAAESQKEYDEALAKHKEDIAKVRATKDRYETMLSHVRAWTPPTLEHTGLKTFMVDQIVESIRFDCEERFYKAPVLKSPSEWHADALAKAKRDVEYHRGERAKEVDRSAGKTAWVKALRQSLAA
jgi:hypothetical protein